MCLTPKPNSKIEIAKEDIPVFKVLRKSGKDFVGPYQSTVYVAGQLYTQSKFSASINSTITFDFEPQIPLDKVQIFEGIHAFVSYFDAVEATRYTGQPLIVNALVPKGTPYILGVKGDIVSLALKIENAIGDGDLSNEFNGTKTLPTSINGPKIGDRVLVLKADYGAIGAEGLEGIVTNERSTSGLGNGNGLHVKVENTSYGNGVWAIGKTAKVKILAKAEENDKKF